MSYVYEKYDFSLFENRFRDYSREESFSREGLRTLFSYLESLAEDSGEPIEIDAIALCCEFSEEEAEKVLAEHDCESFDDFADNTWAVELDNGNILYQIF